ncbi:hypothetical protein [Lentisalinibacter salinarum]|uniref:hypothetical protein n=1 Tax=Lentisalinibacter salinarum TaxID=2992239 RepID=UPI0038650BF0
MQRLTAAPGIAVFLLVAATSVWWLSSLALVPPSLPGASVAISATAATACITGQWILIAVLTPFWTPRDTPMSEALPILAAASLPLWPLLAMLWAATGIDTLTLAATQAGAAALFGVVLLGRELISRLPVGEETAQPLAVALGASVAAGIWLARSPISNWVQP